MKTIRYLAASLLLITGVLHFLPMIKSTSDPNALPMLIFGIVFFAVGVLLFMNIKYSAYLGILFPLVGLATGFFVVGISKWTAMLTFMFAIDLVVIICCILLLLNKKKATV
jgi:hypothetical protein